MTRWPDFPTFSRNYLPMQKDYEDIIHLPHYEPKSHPRMPAMARAAQFAPFAAIPGTEQEAEEEEE